MAGKLVRRSFLVGSAAVAGGVAFGVYYVRRPYPNPLLDELEEGEAALTPYVKIDAEGVTLITPRADLGQGVMSIQAYLLAEELDVNPHTVRLDFGPADPAYYNRVVTEAAAPFRGWEAGWMREQVRALFRIPAKVIGAHITGGSTSVPAMYDVLREAGASARETLKKAASKRAGVAMEALRTEDGAVVLPDGQRLSYAELAPDAAKVSPVSDVPLRDPADWRWLGKKIDRVDVPAKSTGACIYGIDLRFESMLHATVRTNPGLGAGVKRFDASKAEGMRGVKKIVPISNGVGVIADNTWRAFRAADAIDFEWEPGPYPATSEQMWSELERSETEERRDSRLRDDGDVDAALAEGPVLEAEYRLPHLAHAPLEPISAVVRVEADAIDIWTGTQIPVFVRQHVAELTGYDMDAIRVHNQPLGGSFGRRLEDTYVLQAVEVAQAVEGTPVKMTWSREEDMSHDYPREMHLGRCRGTVRDGRIETFDVSSIAASLSASQFGRTMGGPPPGPDPLIVMGAWDQPFAIPNYRVTGYRAPEMVPISSWRAPGANSNGFIHECFFDELALAAGVDPLEERIRLCVHDASRKVLEALRELSGWDGPGLGPNRGRGVAFTYSHDVPAAEVVEVTKTDRGIRIDRVFAVVDVGRVLDPVNLEAQLFGGVIWGLGHAVNCELTYADYRPQQTNFHAHAGLRLYQTPEIQVRALENGKKIRGAGEPTVPPAAPALANAIYAATGQRIRQMPLNKHIDFV